MSTLEKIDNIKDDITDLKVILARLDENLKKNTEILDRLTASVEEHVKRSDSLEQMVLLDKQDLQNKKDSDKLIWTVLCAVGVVLLALEKLGVFNKLF